MAKPTIWTRWLIYRLNLRKTAQLVFETKLTAVFININGLDQVRPQKKSAPGGIL